MTTCTHTWKCCGDVYQGHVAAICPSVWTIVFLAMIHKSPYDPQSSTVWTSWDMLQGCWGLKCNNWALNRDRISAKFNSCFMALNTIVHDQTEGHVTATCPWYTSLIHFHGCVHVVIMLSCYISPLHVPAIHSLVCTERDFVAAACIWDMSLLHGP